MFKRKDSSKPLPTIQPGNLDTLHNTKKDIETQKIFQKHQQIMLLMIDAKYTYLNQSIFEEIKDLFDPLKESQDNIIKKLLESNMSLILKNTIFSTKCGDFIKPEREHEKILKIC